MGWVQWPIDRITEELVGPCGCRVPNTMHGFHQAKDHQCTRGAE